MPFDQRKNVQNAGVTIEMAFRLVFTSYLLALQVWSLFITKGTSPLSIVIGIDTYIMHYPPLEIKVIP